MPRRRPPLSCCATDAPVDQPPSRSLRQATQTRDFALSQQLDTGLWSPPTSWLNLDGVFQSTRANADPSSERWADVRSACGRFLPAAAAILNNETEVRGELGLLSTHSLPGALAGDTIRGEEKKRLFFCRNATTRVVGTLLSCAAPSILTVPRDRHGRRGGRVRQMVPRHGHHAAAVELLRPIPLRRIDLWTGQLGSKTEKAA